MCTQLHTLYVVVNRKQFGSIKQMRRKLEEGTKNMQQIKVLGNEKLSTSYTGAMRLDDSDS